MQAKQMRNSSQILEYLTAHHNISEKIVDDVYAYAKVIFVCVMSFREIIISSSPTRSATTKNASTGSASSSSWRRPIMHTLSTPSGVG